MHGKRRWAYSGITWTSVSSRGLLGNRGLDRYPRLACIARVQVSRQGNAECLLENQGLTRRCSTYSITWPHTERVVDYLDRLDRLVERAQLDERLLGARLVEGPADRALESRQAIGALERREYSLGRGHQRERVLDFLALDFVVGLHGRPVGSGWDCQCRNASAALVAGAQRYRLSPKP